MDHGSSDCILKHVSAQISELLRQRTPNDKGCTCSLSAFFRFVDNCKKPPESLIYPTFTSQETA